LSSSSASQYPLSMSPSCGVKPMMDSMESAAQQLCSMTRMAQQHPGPRNASPLMKRMMISPVHDLTSTSASQHCCASAPSSRSASAGRP
jgi:hypothetical protein